MPHAAWFFPVSLLHRRASAVDRPEQHDRLRNATEGLIGHISAQLKAGHYSVDDIPDLLDRVAKHVEEVYRPRRPAPKEG